METNPGPGETAPATAGRLQGIVVAELVRDLHRARRTGTLLVRNAWITRCLVFEEGRIVFVDSDAPDDRLGEFLVREGSISFERLVASPSGTQASLGARLVESGSLEAGSLDRAMRSRARAIVADLFRAEEGEYEFRDGALPDDAPRLELSMADLILHGIRNVRSFRMLRCGVGSPRVRYRVAHAWSGGADAADLGEAERLVLSRLGEGPAAIEALCADLPVSNFEIYQSLWALRLLGAVERGPVPVDPDAGLAGQLDREEFLAVLVRLCRDGETGVLRVARGAVDRTFQIKEGRCVFATSTDPDDGLVSHLFRRGVISLKDREEVARRLLTNKRVGTILLELGALDEDDVTRMVREQVTEILNDTARWDSGEYAFTPGELPTLEEITLDSGVEDLVVQAVRRIPSWSRALAALGGPDTRLEVSPRYLDVLDRMTVGGAEWDVVALLAQPRTVLEVCRASGLGDFRVCQTLWALRLLGAVAPAAAVTPEPAVASAAPDPAPEPEPIQEPEQAPIEAASPAEGPQAEAPGEPAPEPPVAADLVPAESEPATEPAVQESAPVESAPVEAAPVAASEGPSFEIGTPGCDTEPFMGDMSPLSARRKPSEDEGRTPLEPEAERQVEWLNACQQIVYRVVRAEVGAGAANFIRFCGARMPEGLGAVFAQVDLMDDGTWDVLGMRRALRGADPAALQDGFRRVLEKEVEMVQVHLGPEHAEALRRKIDEFEKAGAA
jgi:hypothetical protein